MSETIVDGEWLVSLEWRGIMNVMSEDCTDCAFTYLEYFASLYSKVIQGSDPNKEKTLNLLLKGVDYYLDFIRFSLHCMSDSLLVNLKSLQKVNLVIGSMEKSFLDFGCISEENKARSLRIQTCFHDIFSALEECGQERQDGTIVPSSRPCEPFIKYADMFLSEEAKDFMISLRRINIRVRKVAARVILQELHDLFSTSIIGQLALTEIETDTAMRSITFILEEINKRLYREDYSLLEDDLDQNRCTFLMTSFVALNQPGHLREKESNVLDYKNYVERRVEVVSCFLDAMQQKILPESTRPVLERIPSAPLSRLWQKLLVAGSEGAFVEGKEEEKCPVCLKDNVTRQNFSVLDNCDHLFCAQCIAEAFEWRSTCPLCRTTISRWTTRDHFAASKTKQ